MASSNSNKSSSNSGKGFKKVEASQPQAKKNAPAPKVKREKKVSKAVTASSKPSPASAKSRDKKSSAMNQQASNYIPEEVSKRMVRRATWMGAVPTALGMTAFFINYFLLIKHVIEIPTWFTYAETLSLFGLGFFGLSYGVLSASWEPEQEGSFLGFSEFRFNIGILFQQWREYNRSKSDS